MRVPLLEVRHLSVHYGGLAAVDDVSFSVGERETLGLVGESGAGKSTLARAVLRLVPAVGSVWLDGENLSECGGARLRRHRRHLQIVFQDPLASLDPRMSVGRTLAEPLLIHEPALPASERAARVAAMLERVGLGAAATARLPREFSGGECQRIAIARAMMLRPRLLVCDEPVSSLDVSIQGQIVNLLADLQQEFGTAMLFISHNLAVVRHLCPRVLVMYRGRVVEAAPRDALFAAPAHPYTRALLAAVPDPEGAPGAALTRARAEGGAAAAAPSVAAGCGYLGRCPHAGEICRREPPPLQEVAPQHRVACHRWREVVYS